MKTMKYKGVKTVGITILLLFMGMISAAQGIEPITISLVSEKQTYQPGEAIKMQIKVFNGTAQDVITRKGFFNQDFHLRISFTDPDGNTVNSKFQDSGSEGGPAHRYQDKDAVFAEIIPPADMNTGANVRTVIIDDARTLYNLTKPGLWKAQVFVSFEGYLESTTDTVTGDILAFLDDRQAGTGFVASEKISFQIASSTPVVKSTIRVNVTNLKIGPGKTPTTKKTPLENVQVNLYRTSQIPNDYKPINHKTYPLIRDYLDPVASNHTDAKGIADFSGIEKDNYVVIALYGGSQDFKHIGSEINTSDPGWNSGLVETYLMVMETVNGQSTPGKTTKLTGSLLLITEPEYIAWDSSQELYPFVFETIGDWGVTVTIAPPEGFVADYSSLSTRVIDTAAAVQFSVKDVGSRWVETGVTFTITHKKKVQTLKDKIGIKLSKKLAEKKGLSIYGETGTPGTFVGGKKVKQGSEE
jgi:hypothetical protein